MASIALRLPVYMSRIYRLANKTLLSRGCSSTQEEPPNEDFGNMLRNSQFVKLGRPAGKKVLGQVSHVVTRERTKDVYVDFGWKFHAVQSHPISRDLKVGDEVEVHLKSLEATGHFLGQSKRITLCEAEAKFTLIGREEGQPENTETDQVKLFSHH